LQNALYDWSNGSNLNSNSITQAGTYWLTVSQQGCATSDTVTITYKPLPIVYLGNDTTLCETTTLLLNASNNNATYKWQDGNNNATYPVNNGGKYYVAVNINDCVINDTININYTPIPNFTLGNDLFICKGIEYKLDPVMNTTVDYLWQDGSHASFFNVNTDGLYILKASNSCGIFADSVKVTTAICQLQLPTAFTPNNDGYNDIFRVIRPFPVKQFHMAVYNRWGQKIFESSDIYKGWNGTFNQTSLPTGTYVWFISLTDEEGKQQNAKGSVMLIY